MNRSEQDDELIESAIRGERRAFELLFNRHHGLVYTLALKLTGNNKELSEEITQDSFLKAFHHLTTFKRESAFSTWLYKIAVSTAMSAMRKKKKSLPLEYRQDTGEEGSDQQDWEDTDYDKKLNANELNAAIRQLSPSDNLMITLFYLHEQSIENISQILGKDKNFVKVNLFRARQRLKKILLKRST